MKRARRALVERLPEQPRGRERAPLGPLAERARWRLPGAVACVVVRSAGGLSVPGADAELLSVSRGGDLVLVVPEPETSGLVDRVRAAARDRVTVVGPAVPAPEAWLSPQCVRLALDRRADLPAHPDGGVFLRLDDELAELHLLRAAPIGRLLGLRVLAVFADLPTGRAGRLAETLDALLMSWGRTAPEVARALGIHPQTARKRLRRLEALFGARLEDSRFRFEALLALRPHALRPHALRPHALRPHALRPDSGGARGSCRYARVPSSPTDLPRRRERCDDAGVIASPDPLTGTPPSRIPQTETHGLDVIADAERKGTPRTLFRPWFGADVSVLGLSHGAFAFGFLGFLGFPGFLGTLVTRRGHVRAQVGRAAPADEGLRA
ncbi:helix-turn-helix domain-containing protein [Streptomyces sp. NPDC007808]|uniref:helix-turn-helix domain-containing protein n=1 Tax=Streptomyces sp. NPDC007808 TaxID=3364779 RepID=UPI0036836DCD